MRNEKEPTVTSKTVGKCRPHEKFDHDAFATITMTTVHGGGATLFGSDIGHGDRIRISIQRASLERDLSRDWIHGQTVPIIDFEMSHAQFAQFITSNANGNGTPVTLRSAPERDTPTDEMPAIKNVETKHEIHRREIHDMSKVGLDDIYKEIARLGEMIDGGRAGKKELKEIHHALKCRAENLPGNMKFVVEQAERALEKATSDAKIEVEAYIQNTAARIGLKRISELTQLENKTDCEHAYSRSMLQDYPRKCIHCGETEKS